MLPKKEQTQFLATWVTFARPGNHPLAQCMGIALTRMCWDRAHMVPAQAWWSVQSNMDRAGQRRVSWIEQGSLLQTAQQRKYSPS